MTDSYGSKATEEKIYVGRIKKYYPKAKVAEALTEALELSVGDKIIIMGPETGVVESTLKSLRSDDEKEIKKSGKKEIVTFSIEKPVRKNDKLYVLRKRME